MILSIESSCDDSSIALTSIETCRLVYHAKISQDEAHTQYGGVVPEIASRLHAQNLPRILGKVKAFLDSQGLDFGAIRAIAVTNRPGLSVTLSEGVCMGNALALSLQKPIIYVNHLKGHIFSLFINQREIFQNLGVLLVSGGHTQILKFGDFENVRICATTLDDSFGESFDKTAKMLGLGYPGGPVVEKMASEFVGRFSESGCSESKGAEFGDLGAGVSESVVLESRRGFSESGFSKSGRGVSESNIPEFKGDLAINFPIALLHDKRLAFSFSGLKNAVRLQIQAQNEQGGVDAAQICYFFQKAAVEHLMRKLERYFSESGDEFETFGVVGGASANAFLRRNLEDLCARFGKRLIVAPLEFCADNAAMIGRLGVESFKRGKFDEISDCISPKSLTEDFLDSEI